MTHFQGIWIKLEQKGCAPGARSSHAVAVVGNKAYVFGGEHVPRVPLDNKIYVFDLDDLTWTIPEVSGDVPPARVGVTMAAVAGKIYVYGGRDSEHSELNELYCFDTSTNTWTLLSSGEVGPAPRSYHSTTADARHVYIFGGCGVAGRLNDLWAFNVEDGQWVSFPGAGEGLRGRGGPGLAVSGGKIWVLYGFAGEEMDDVHCFDLEKGVWAQIETKGQKPSPRSVFCTVGLGKCVFMYGGEVDPSDQGHLGAGMFSGEAFWLDTDTLEWTRWEGSGNAGEWPGPRGWCAFSGGRRSDSEGLLVYGGNSPTNERLDDIYFFNPM